MLSEFVQRKTELTNASTQGSQRNIFFCLKVGEVQALLSQVSCDTHLREWRESTTISPGFVGDV